MLLYILIITYIINISNIKDISSDISSLFDIMLEAPKDLTKWITDVEVVKMNDAKEFNYPYDIRHLPLVISMDYKRVNSENLLNS